MHLKPYFIILIFAGLLAGVSCKKYKENQKKIHTKKEITMGTDVQPEEDVLNSEVSDTATFYAHTIKHEASRSYIDQYKYLGSNQDPVFGRTDASIFTNFGIANSVSNLSFGNDAVLDSAELILTFTQNYVGDTTTALNYKVHQIATALNPSTSYYMNDASVMYSPTTLCNTTARISNTGGFYTIRLPLDYNFASAIITNSLYLVNNSVFQSVYKGFYITTSGTSLYPGKEGALMKIDLDNPVSGVYMYYHNTSASQKVSKTYRFPFASDNAVRFNRVSYAYNSIPNNQFSWVVNHNDTTVQKNGSLFLKGLAGTKVVYRLPYLQNYAANEKISVSRAEVIFKVDQTFTASASYEPPLQLALVAMDDNGRETYVKDQYYATDALRYGGSYDPVAKQYVFNIARHVQDIMRGKIKNTGFYLVVANPDFLYVARRDDRAARVVLGGKGSLYAPTFKLSFVRYSHDS